MTLLTGVFDQQVAQACCIGFTLTNWWKSSQYSGDTQLMSLPSEQVPATTCHCKAAACCNLADIASSASGQHCCGTLTFPAYSTNCQVPHQWGCHRSICNVGDDGQHPHQTCWPVNWWDCMTD